MAYWPHHLREIIRRLSRTAGFASVAVLTIALGIGANTAIFSVINGVLLKPLPYPKPDELVGMWHTAPGHQHSRTQSGAIELLHLSGSESDSR